MPYLVIGYDVLWKAVRNIRNGQVFDENFLMSIATIAAFAIGEYSESLSMTQSAVSHQLRILKASQLVSARREGKSMYYSLADDHVRTIMAQGMEHVME